MVVDIIYINRSKNGEKQIINEGMERSYFCAVKDGKNKQVTKRAA